MARFFHYHTPEVWRRASTFLLAFFFLAGILSGACIFEGSFSVSWMRSFLMDSVSIVSLILFTFLPFLISAFAVFLKIPGLILILSFAKGCLFGLSALQITFAFADAGWLARFMLLFSDLISLPLLFFFWQRYISGVRKLEQRELLLYFALVSLICSIDFCLISPFAARIIIF